MIILKVTKDQGFTLALKDTFFEVTGGRGVKLTPPTVLGLSDTFFKGLRLLVFSYLIRV